MQGKLCGIAALCFVASVDAATFNVTSLADSGPGTLRDAVAQANAAPGADTITFGVTGTITLSAGISITGPVTIQGPGAANLAIDGNNVTQIFNIADNPFANCPATSGPADYAVSISGVTLRNASTNGTGGAIATWHSLALDGVVIRDSKAQSGGAVAVLAQYTGQSLTITNSELVGNLAHETPGSSGRSAGGAIAVFDYCASPDPTSVPVTITNTQIHGNQIQTATLNAVGGAMLIESLAVVTITDSRIYDNHVALATSNPNATTRAGAIRFSGKSIRLERTEIAENSAPGNGAFQFQNFDPARQGPADIATVAFVNSTVSANATTNGGSSALVNGNVAVELYNSTYANNVPLAGGGGSAGVIFLAQGGLTVPTLKLESSILHNPLEGGLDILVDPTIVNGLDVTANRSLIGKVDAFNGVVNFVGGGSGNLLGLDPVLGALAFNGGTTRTQALLTASPAIDAGSNPLALTVDQRAGAFSRVQGASADMGAFEYPASCAGLTDVDYLGPFCSSVAWIKNRDVTQGCSAGAYCPQTDVSRVAMAAFMKRLGTALSGTVVGLQQSLGPIDPGATVDPFFCILGVNGEMPAAKYPRRVHLDGVLNGIANGDTGVQIEIVAALDWGGRALASVATSKASFAAGRWTQVHALGHFDLPAGQPLAVALIVSRGGLPGTATLTDSDCKLRARLESRDGASAPFDGAAP